MPGAGAAAGARCWMERGGSGGLPRLRDGCANGMGAEIPSSTMCGWAQGHFERLRGRGAERGDGGDGDGGSAGVFALGVCLCCRALNRGHRVTPRLFGARGRAAGRQGRKLFCPRAGRGARSILRLLLCLRGFSPIFDKFSWKRQRPRLSVAKGSAELAEGVRGPWGLGGLGARAGRGHRDWGGGAGLTRGWLPFLLSPSCLSCT